MNTAVMANASTPTGRLMKKTQRQEKLSVSQPPSSGPKIGPRIAPAPQMAITWPTWLGGKMSRTTACDSGISAAPKMPCSNRKPTISASEWAMPQSMEATVKPAIETRNVSLRPTLMDSHPVKGVMIAAATM
jgi:hypothetical protein